MKPQFLSSRERFELQEQQNQELAKIREHREKMQHRTSWFNEFLFAVAIGLTMLMAVLFLLSNNAN